MKRKVQMGMFLTDYRGFRSFPLKKKINTCTRDGFFLKERFSWSQIFLFFYFFSLFEFIHTWWLHNSPSPTAGQRAVAAAGAEEVNASLKAFSVVLSTAHEHYISAPPTDCPCWQMDLLLVQKKGIKKGKRERPLALCPVCNLHLETGIFMAFFPP